MARRDKRSARAAAADRRRQRRAIGIARRRAERFARRALRSKRYGIDSAYVRDIFAAVDEHERRMLITGVDPGRDEGSRVMMVSVERARLRFHDVELLLVRGDGTPLIVDDVTGPRPRLNPDDRTRGDA